jgi:hypothetical protein
MFIAYVALAAVILLAFDDLWSSLSGGQSVGMDFNKWADEAYDKFMKLGSGTDAWNISITAALAPLRMWLTAVVALRDTLYSLAMLFTGGGAKGFGQMWKNLKANMGGVTGGFFNEGGAAAGFGAALSQAGSTYAVNAGLSPSSPANQTYGSSPTMNSNIVINASPGQSPDAIGAAAAQAIDERWNSMVEKAAGNMLTWSK